MLLNKVGRHVVNSRNFATQTFFKKCHLANRSVIRVAGTESADFLHGLMTNDIDHLAENHEENQETRTIYAMFLNTQGRVMFDTFISKPNMETHEEFLIDCDKELSGKLVKHLKMYKVRRKLTIELQENQHVMAYFHPGEISKPLPDETMSSHRDTRVRELGFRVISSDISAADTDINEYKLLRYRLGVCEGSQEIPFAKATPLEHNVAYMHGVSFQKGCYLGQELTARTHHTGIIRKRIMPLEFSQEISNFVEGSVEEEKILNEKGKNVGVIRGIHGKFGIGLCRMQECLSAQKLTVFGDIQVTVTKPTWWPQVAPKTSRPQGFS